MHDDDNRFQRFVPLLRRVIILLAVLAATPVVLWMITTFVRAYVGPPRIPALRQIASTQQMAAPATAAASTPSSEASTKVADITASTTDVTATTSEARDAASLKGSMLADRPSDAANLPTNAPVSSMPSPSQTSAAPASAAPIGQSPAANTMTAEASPPPAVAEQQPDVMPPAPPLTGKIPLPRHRPRGLGDATMTQLAQGAVPVPRPRPDAAGPVATPETPNSGPLDFLQNMFHQ